MKIFYITMEFPCPSETFASNDVRALRDAGVGISVYALKWPHPDAQRLIEERKLTDVEISSSTRSTFIQGMFFGFRRPKLLLKFLRFIFRYNWRNLEHLLKSLLLAPRALQLFSLLEREKPEVVHVYWGHYPSMVAYLVQDNLPEVVVTISFAAYDLEMQYGGSVPVARQADAVRTLGKVNLAQIEKSLNIPRERVNIVYDGVDLRLLEHIGKNTQKIKRRIITAGRLIPSKGMEDVLKVFHNIFNRFPDASLVVLGDGPERARLEALAKSLGIDHAITFRGHVRHETVIEEMMRSEIFLFMSKKSSERLPNVVKEALGCKCLCVTTQTPGIDELIVHGEYGYIVPQGDVASATQYVNHALSDDSTIASMTESAYHHLISTFDLNVSIARYQAMWTTLVTQRAKQRQDGLHEKQSPTLGYRRV